MEIIRCLHDIQTAAFIVFITVVLSRCFDVLQTAVPSPLVYDVVEDSSLYDIASCSYIDDSTRQRLLVGLCLLQVSECLFLIRLLSMRA